MVICWVQQVAITDVEIRASQGVKHVSDPVGMIVPVATRYFIDETKAKRYLVVVVACPDESLRVARSALRRLVLPGQRSIHMKSEADRRRRTIATSVAGLAAERIAATAIVVSGGGHEHNLRERALREVVNVAARSGGGSLLLDLDPTQERRDQRVLIEALRDHATTPLSFSHARLADEPLLTLPDVVAWCVARGRIWRGRIDPILSEVRRV